MLSLPITLVVALVMAFLAARLVVLREGPPLFVALLLAASAQGTIVALVQHYGLSDLRILQPVFASSLPPLAYLAFRQAAVLPLALRRDLVHASGPGLVLLGVVAGAGWANWLPDALLAALYCGYGAAILVLARSRTGLPLASLAQGNLPAMVWQVIALALILSAGGDVAIAIALSEGHTWLRGAIVSVVSSLALLSIGLLALIDAAPASAEPEAQADPANGPETPATDADPNDGAILARLSEHLETTGAYRDPDLTLARLARRLGLPAKMLSAAINRSTGGNISRYVNGYRIRHACRLLDDGDTVTAAMLASGFNTKSNFNREFLRVTGTTPSAYRPQRRGD